MQVFRYGIELRRLSAENLERVRIWRNQPQIRQTMRFRDEISPEMQLNWFKKIDNPENYFFVMYAQDAPFGLIDAKNIDWENRTGETGIFIGDERFLGSFAPVCCSLAMLDFVFERLGLTSVFARTLSQNQTAIQYNSRLGFCPEPDPNPVEGCELFFRLTRENYEKQSSKLKKAAIQLGGTENRLIYSPALYPIDAELAGYLVCH